VHEDLVLEDMFAAPQASGGHSAFELSLEEAHPAPAARPVPPPARPSAGGKLSNLAGELSDMLGDEPAPARAPAPAPPAAPTRPSAPAAAQAAAGAPSGGILDDVFAEFRDEMDEPAAAGGDIETHYNMGVAFKEMALYDEAIGEFQKAHHLAEQAKDTSHLVQCCSLLATCFLEKGLPLLAVRWYQTALGAPGLDPDSSTALLYETGSAYELAGDRAAALKSFMEVYARNIDYRNVSERIRDLQ
jgi:tetratricopeptide (TPR) repeat protein